ncbi:hypothetical protein CIL05_10895 [Virgibacillus profundi]|uniref:RNA polymerase subunit sigma-24 n=1 Tax=Virgibacillus profundi TaxID=2024555 RepID=A0A2A2ICA8_9BACI|nr:sigma-70 family RNA polymerase sigma factor [Virgibacillus profundi]PAV29369.1 hypothetical protein CIL05_10895 [Virgibacillus profundi]PXY53539.1 RNA polymerase subunit sigma-24 [Virgibacillus profundi]
MASLIEQLHKKYATDVYRYLLSLTKNHHTSEEITQETFYRAYIFLHDSRIDNEKAWLFRVAHNTYIDYLRKNKRFVIKEQDYFHQIKTLEKSIEDQYLSKEMLDDLRLSLDKLPVKQKQAILLADFNNLSYKEAAEILEVTPNYFKILLFRARQKLRVSSRGC